MAQNLLAGKTGSVTIGATTFSFGKWEVEVHSKMVPVPNFNGAGAEQYVAGLYGGKLTVSGPYDMGNMPFTVGTQYTWSLALNASVVLSLPAIVDSIKPSVDVEGAAMITITAQSNGTFTPSIT